MSQYNNVFRLARKLIDCGVVKDFDEVGIIFGELEAGQLEKLASFCVNLDDDDTLFDAMEQIRETVNMTYLTKKLLENHVQSNGMPSRLSHNMKELEGLDDFTYSGRRHRDLPIR